MGFLVREERVPFTLSFFFPVEELFIALLLCTLHIRNQNGFLNSNKKKIKSNNTAMQEGQHDAGPPSVPSETGNPFEDSGNPCTDGNSGAEGTTQPPQYQTSPTPNFQQQSSYAPVPVTPSAYPSATTNDGSPQPQSTFYSVQMHSSTPTSNPDYTQAPTYSINNDPPSIREKVEYDYSSDNLRTDEPTTSAFAIKGGEGNPFEDDDDFSSDSEDEGKGTPIEPKKPLGVIGLVSMVYFLVAGGAYGTEDLGGSIPALFALGGKRYILHALASYVML